MNVALRIHGPASVQAPTVFLAIGVCVIVVSERLGGRMVHVHGVGVEGRE